MLSPDEMGTKTSRQGQGQCRLFKSVIYLSMTRRPKEIVRVPEVSTYGTQIQKCQEMYSRLQLDRSLTMDVPRTVTSTPFPRVQHRPVIGQPRPLTYSQRQHASKYAGVRPYSIRSAPAFVFNDSQNQQKELDLQEIQPEVRALQSDSSSCDYDENGRGRKRTRMDPETLCDHLKDKGYGVPSVMKSNERYNRLSQMLPKGVKIRPLSKNPSAREKIKGQARLDQEMANMKAIAFCEQQAPKVFRTASDHMRNRDLQFVEEEMREHIHREAMDDDDNVSIVMMPMTREELFIRIDTWLRDVETACGMAS